MRLWHQELIPQLPKYHLLGQWRECIALLGNGWKRKHKTVDYVFGYPESHLLAYSLLIYREMEKRGYKPDLNKAHGALRKRLTYHEIDIFWNQAYEILGDEEKNKKIFKEHDLDYHCECLERIEKWSNAKNLSLEGGD